MIMQKCVWNYMCMDFHPNKAVKITLDKIENLYLKLALKNIY